jgi:hypothetical protein
MGLRLEGSHRTKEAKQKYLSWKQQDGAYVPMSNLHGRIHTRVDGNGGALRARQTGRSGGEGSMI